MARDRASRPEAKPLRLFVAIEVPDHAARVLAGAIEPWRAAFPKARWAPRENWHVTLKFLGRTYPRLLEWVPARLAEVAAEIVPFRTLLTGLGAFPSPGRARVVWAGLDDGSGRMAGLALAIGAALSKELPPERRAFTPHLTLARSDPPLALPDGFVATRLQAEPFKVERFVLVRSHLRRPAPRYEPLGAFPLGG